ncbi:hypothetical protein SARC_08530 [Sphaeroforma arctica JP610]|uniref:EF-hand domain-containing protein n=1 Tax=Sphaeroforma arctica JP610 TaxID=667725 RepID=A0A0L0FSY8_9EUKA|nr:hypothetical protein SARC_08530 [Sphaeroforma arctica JP610]KNC79063.1 hypothetical protein SARC_08530 [Sphaeroforma arctica JP610]|eukprot:XP_014152965.1 hypothetical protein SARC_08530 [Sphaeroforma arctica JP610]
MTCASTLFTAIDQPIDNIERIFKDLDLDRNGTLDKDELMTYLRSPAFSCRPMTYSLLSFLADGQLGLDQLISSSYSNVATLGGKKNKSLLAVQDGDSIKTGLLMIQDRKTGLLMEEHVPKFVKMALNLMYRDGLGKKLVYRKRVNNLLKSMSEKEGRKMDHPHSKKKIHSFVAQHSLDVDELLLPLDTECTNYPNFNEFFYRKLKPGARPLASSDDDSVLVSPADCRLMAFDTIDRATNLWVKGRNFSVATVLTEAFSDVFPKNMSTLLTHTAAVDGPLYTVNPVAIKEKLDVYPANKREICEVHTKDFGLVMMVCVGATMVGSINITAEDGSEVKRGDEHGYFAFGGSTVVIFFEKNRVKFDSDLLLAASRPVETLVTVGMKIGVAVSEQGKN